MKLCIALRLCCALLLLLPACCWGESAAIPASFDRWNYPFNASAGSRLSASTFGAVGNPQFDDHDAQLILGFDTRAAGIPPEAHIRSIVVQLTTSTENAFQYDPSYDPFVTYTDEAADADAGRPVELYGVGFRNGFVFPAFGASAPGPVAFEEDEAFVFGNPAAKRVRNAFMSDYAVGPRDVSNNVSDGIELSPWAVGTVNGLAPGADVPLHSTMMFDVSLGSSNVADYVDRGIESGGLFFTVASMHASTQGSNAGIPSFFTGDANLPNLDLAVAQLNVEYEVVPEATSSLGLLLGAAGLVIAARRRR